jgi:hypothetical protein
VVGAGRGHVKPQFFIFTEGKATEVEYFAHWARATREDLTFIVDEVHGVDPFQLVGHAVARKKALDRDLKRGRAGAYESVWCVFDRDEHLRVPEALALAQQHGIEVALSNPCFELWLLLHFQDQTRHLHRTTAQRESGKHVGTGNGRKHLPQEHFVLLAARIGDAIRRAQGLASKHEGDGSHSWENPSSGMYRLVQRTQDAVARHP